VVGAEEATAEEVVVVATAAAKVEEATAEEEEGVATTKVEVEVTVEEAEEATAVNKRGATAAAVAVAVVATATNPSASNIRPALSKTATILTLVLVPLYQYVASSPRSQLVLFQAFLSQNFSLFPF